jgi:peptidyl-tRNA hydrolase
VPQVSALVLPVSGIWLGINSIIQVVDDDKQGKRIGINDPEKKRHHAQHYIMTITRNERDESLKHIGAQEAFFVSLF